jgi:hypothetical protein
MNTALPMVRRLAALTAVCVLGALAASSVASADTVVGTQNPNVTVRASLRSITGDQYVVSRGSLIFASLSVTNNAAATEWYRLELLGSWPSGSLPADLGGLYQLEPGKTYRIAFPIYVPRWAPTGLYTLGLRAFGEGYLDPSEAIASITVQ